MGTFNVIRPVLTASLALLLILANTHAVAADNDDRGDPPDRVARLSYLKGDVSLRPAGTGDWANASLNRPLTTDDQLFVDRGARAELQAGSLNIHLDGDTAFSFSELSDNVLQARITDGAVHLNVRRMRNGETIEIDTPHAAITIAQPGEYHVEVVDDGARTLVKTYSGEAEVAGSRESLRLRSREQVMVNETGQPVASRGGFSQRNDFDSWANQRNGRHTRSASSRYVAPDVIGYEDLDDYGDWEREADYGHVWYPSRVAVGWSPYRHGHWTWVSPWGWTWVDDAPWGFAPFHYGRWAHVHNRWGWVPGPIHVHAVYAPALVAWVGGPHIGVSVSFGSNIGWFPLAPREIYVPGYHFSRHHIHNVNYANTVIVNNVIINRAYANRSTHIDYRNRDVRDAVTVVSRDAFVSARPVSNHLVRVGDRDLRNLQTHNATPAVAPDRASRMGSRWDGRESRAPERLSEQRANREVISRHVPPPARASFDVEQRAIRENSNRPVPSRDLFPNPADARRSDAMRNEVSRGDRPTDRPRRLYDRALEEGRPQAAQPVPSQERPPRAQVQDERTNRSDRFDRPDRTARPDREIGAPRERSAEPSRERSAEPSPRERSAEPSNESPRLERREQLRVEPPRERESFERSREFDRPRNIEQQRPVERAVERPIERPVEQIQRIERSERFAAPRRAEPPPQQEQRQERMQRQYTPPPSDGGQRGEQREERTRGRESRREVER